MRAERESWEKKQQDVSQLASELRNVRVNLHILLTPSTSDAQCTRKIIILDLITKLAIFGRNQPVKTCFAVMASWHRKLIGSHIG